MQITERKVWSLVWTNTFRSPLQAPSARPGRQPVPTKLKSEVKIFFITFKLLRLAFTTAAQFAAHCWSFADILEGQTALAR